MIKGSFWKTSRGWISQLDVVPYLFWYDPFYHGNFRFKAKLGLGTVLLTFSYHSDSKNGSCNKLFTNWVLVPYQEIQALGFPNSLRKLGLYEKPWACISWYGPYTQLVNSKYWLRAMFKENELASSPLILHKANILWYWCNNCFIVWLKVFVVLHNESVARPLPYVARQNFFLKICRIIMPCLFLRMKVKLNIFSVLNVSLKSCNIYQSSGEHTSLVL